MIEIKGIPAGELEIKRCHLPGVKIKVTCPKCKEKYTPSAEILKDLGINKKISLNRGIGCAKCNYLGFSGRSAVFELLTVDDDIRDLIIKKASADEIHKLAVSKGMKPLIDDGKEKVKKHLTTPEEILRVMQTY